MSLEQEKLQRTKKLESRVTKAKEDYSLALKRLEGISFEIHEKRKQRKQSLALDPQGNCEAGRESPALYSPIPEFRRLSLISSTPNRTGKCTAVVYPWTMSEEPHDEVPLSPVAGSHHHVSASLSSYSNMSDCDSELGSIETLDTLDDSAIDRLMLGSQIESHLKTYMSSSVMKEVPAAQSSETKTKMLPPLPKDGKSLASRRHARHESL